jgi:hypothetical protein
MTDSSVTLLELDQLLVAKSHVIRRYDHEVKPNVSLDSELRRAVIIAQRQLLEGDSTRGMQCPGIRKVGVINSLWNVLR